MSTFVDTMAAPRQPSITRQPFVARPARARRPPNGPGVVHLTSEYWPLARTGGLGEAVNGLAHSQAQSQVATTVVMPMHRAVRDGAARVHPVGTRFAVKVGPRTEIAQLFRLNEARPGPDVYLIEHSDYFDRPGIYGRDGADYTDNARRFAFFACAALAVLPTIAPHAQILHAHDWHAALAPAYLRTAFAGQPYYDRLAAVLSVHNAGFQGVFPAEALADIGLSPDAYATEFDWYGSTSVLKGGIAFSDAVVTVSPTHALELCTYVGGCGLHEMFNALGDRLTGILNGIDVDVWNPQTDSTIAAPYSHSDLGGKRICKAALQRAFGLSEIGDAPLFAMSSRLTTQKGIDLILDGRLVSDTASQFAFLGCGEARYEQALTELARRYPGRVGVQLDFNDQREHVLMAGADLLLMPSLYEPCGLAQMRAQLYGTIPVARRVGGLTDTINDGLTGFLFEDYSPEALDQAALRALDVYREENAWQRVVCTAMSGNFGWRTSGERYAQTYRSALARRVSIRTNNATGAINRESNLRDVAGAAALPSQLAMSQ